MEIVRHAASSEESPRVYHYRRGRDEVDLILENRAGDLSAIEVKATTTIKDKDWSAPRTARCSTLALWIGDPRLLERLGSTERKRG